MQSSPSNKITMRFFPTMICEPSRVLLLLWMSALCCSLHSQIHFKIDKAAYGKIVKEIKLTGNKTTKDYVILKMVEPDYPPRELLDGIEGNVLVELFVNTRGEVEDVVVISVLGPKAFEDSSLRAVRQFVFQPPLENGAPATMWVRFSIRFRISG